MKKADTPAVHPATVTCLVRSASDLSVALSPAVLCFCSSICFLLLWSFTGAARDCLLDAVHDAAPIVSRACLRDAAGPDGHDGFERFVAADDLHDDVRRDATQAACRHLPAVEHRWF